AKRGSPIARTWWRGTAAAKAVLCNALFRRPEGLLHPVPLYASHGEEASQHDLDFSSSITQLPTYSITQSFLPSKLHPHMSASGNSCSGQGRLFPSRSATADFQLDPRRLRFFQCCPQR